MRDLKNDARQLLLIAEAVKASGMNGPTLARKVRAAIPRLPKEAREHFERAFGALETLRFLLESNEMSGFVLLKTIKHSLAINPLSTLDEKFDSSAVAPKGIHKPQTSSCSAFKMLLSGWRHPGMQSCLAVRSLE